MVGTSIAGSDSSPGGRRELAAAQATDESDADRSRDLWGSLEDDPDLWGSLEDDPELEGLDQPVHGRQLMWRRRRRARRRFVSRVVNTVSSAASSVYNAATVSLRARAAWRVWGWPRAGCMATSSRAPS